MNNQSGRTVTLLCWAAVLLDGFDLVVLGTVLPVLLGDEVWGLTPATATTVTTVGLIGMTIGALTIGPVTDRIGRRKALIASIVIFSVLTLLCAFAQSAAMFGALRFLAGLGLGGCLPIALTLANEYASSGRRSSSTTLIMTGYHVGAVLTALLGLLILPHWQAMFVIGALPALVLVPLMLKYLPESAAFERSTGHSGLESIRTLFRGGLGLSTLAFWVASFMGLLLVYGLNTWLPTIMRSAGYPLGASLGLLLTLNVGAVTGLLIAGFVADRIGVRPSVLAWFGGATVFLALLSIKLPGGALYAAVFLTGCFVFSAQVLVYAYVAAVYPDRARATAMGAVAGVGRLGAIAGPILGGAMVTAGTAYPWGFYAFAIVGALGATAVLAVRARTAAPARVKAAQH
ncbi:putative MFS family arabinose efflux permease [Actinocorallia herbida]|uniref:Putative MFS family arabinose efflux permease n=1 Tax=Actinocorallia herbida TaxID=58109 RepID=A0A3N1CZB9_9ACTN|nr:aromatic acid/H+ symport family MFS transporter [Actinocorallia herbida]ROO86625.1 putative MFS family arabinose efflux permease [Actinocorallia herbida]